MSISSTIIINCAGMGTRLGFGHPKALLEIEGKSILNHHLIELHWHCDVRVVVGYEYQQVMDNALKIRDDITFVFNHDFKHTSTLASLCLGSKYSNKYIISVDGDLLTKPGELTSFVNLEHEVIGITDTYSEESVCVETRQQGSNIIATNFSKKRLRHEWTGLVKIDRNKLIEGTGHVYQSIKPLLPLKAVSIECREIDTPNDYIEALNWAKYFNWP